MTGIHFMLYFVLSNDQLFTVNTEKFAVLFLHKFRDCNKT